MTTPPVGLFVLVFPNPMDDIAIIAKSEPIFVTMLKGLRVRRKVRCST